MLSLIISTIVFCVAYVLLHRYLDNWGLDKGKARTLIVLTAASLLSYGAMVLAEHITGEPGIFDSTSKLEQLVVPKDTTNVMDE